MWFIYYAGTDVNLSIEQLSGDGIERDRSKASPHEGHCFTVFACADIDDGYDGLAQEKELDTGKVLVNFFVCV